jgi:hypothetical protein
MATISHQNFEKSCSHQSLIPLEWVEGLPLFDPRSFPSILMRVNPDRTVSDPDAPKVLSCDFGINPMATSFEIEGIVIVAGYGLCNYVRNANSQISSLQSKIDTRGNWLAKKEFDELQSLLETSDVSKERNSKSSDYEKKRLKMINEDLRCKDWKRGISRIKENMEQKCRVAREEFATFAALFDIVIIGKNDFREWHKGISHASSGVLSALSLGELRKKIKFKVGLAGGQLVEVSEVWSTKLCSCCGALNDPGNSATYTCSECHVKMNRDENGARSILILAISRVSWILGDYTVSRNPRNGGSTCID